MVFLKLLKIVLTGSYLLEYSVDWCILGECNLPWNQQVLVIWFLEFTWWVAFITKVTACNICLHFVIYVLCHISLCTLLYLVSCCDLPGIWRIRDTRNRSGHKPIWHRTWITKCKHILRAVTLVINATKQVNSKNHQKSHNKYLLVSR